jgi:hypothetical protein
MGIFELDQLSIYKTDGVYVQKKFQKFKNYGFILVHKEKFVFDSIQKNKFHKENFLDSSALEDLRILVKLDKISSLLSTTKLVLELQIQKRWVKSLKSVQTKNSWTSKTWQDFIFVVHNQVGLGVANPKKMKPWGSTFLSIQRLDGNVTMESQKWDHTDNTLRASPAGF